MEQVGSCPHCGSPVYIENYRFDVDAAPIMTCSCIKTSRYEMDDGMLMYDELMSLTDEGDKWER